MLALSEPFYFTKTLNVYIPLWKQTQCLIKRANLQRQTREPTNSTYLLYLSIYLSIYLFIYIYIYIYIYMYLVPGGGIRYFMERLSSKPNSQFTRAPAKEDQSSRSRFLEKLFCHSAWCQALSATARSRGKSISSAASESQISSPHKFAWMPEH